MSWQLWVLLALATAGVVLLAVARMRHARDVFHDITELDRPDRRRAEPVEPAAVAESDDDELARARARHLQQEPDRPRRHG